MTAWIVRLAWQLDQAVNRLGILTGRLAAWATRRSMNEDGEAR